MPFYRPLSPTAVSGYPFRNPVPPDMRRRTADGLLRLRQQFKDDGVPHRTLNQTLLLATWNIREFDTGDKHEPRLAESMYYIAEVLSHFDLIAVQEVREDLAPIDRVMSILGPWWKYIVTDVTYGTAGNGERMAFVYDSRKVEFANLAGEVVLSREQTGKGALQLARTPFLCGFKAHWVRFNLCTVHVYYGDSKPDDPRRVKEVVNLASLLAKYVAPPPQEQPKTQGQPRPQREQLIILGDFNIFSPKDRQAEALRDAGFTVPPELMKQPGSNLDQSKYYDQIAFYTREGRFETTGQAGVFNFYKSVLRDADEKVYAAEMSERSAAKYREAKKPEKYYNEWRTFQMSDHLVLWVELKIDFGERYLQEAAGDAAPPEPTPTPPANDDTPTGADATGTKRQRAPSGNAGRRARNAAPTKRPARKGKTR